jgi:hypothetical protein
MKKFLLTLFGVICMAPAWAHGPEQWIADRGLSDPVTGRWCCSETDCAIVPSGKVREVNGGYLVQATPDSIVQFIPDRRALPIAPDGEYHRCGSPYDIRCFITPPRAF